MNYEIIDYHCFVLIFNAFQFFHSDQRERFNF